MHANNCSNRIQKHYPNENDHRKPEAENLTTVYMRIRCIISRCEIIKSTYKSNCKVCIFTSVCSPL